MFENVREDLRHYAQYCYPGKSPLAVLIRVLYAHPASLAVIWYRFGSACWKSKLPVLKQLGQIVYLLFLPFVRNYTGVQLLPQTEIGPGLILLHFGGVVITRETTIGKNAVLYHNVSLVTAKSRWGPKIGDNFFAGTGTTIIGDVLIEDNVACGAGSLVTGSIPADAIVTGSPAKIKRFCDQSDRFTENMASSKRPVTWMTIPNGAANPNLNLDAPSESSTTDSDRTDKYVVEGPKL